MTNEILDMMEGRRLLKPNQVLYRQNDAEIQREYHKANENMLSQQCDLIEQLGATIQSNLMHEHMPRRQRWQHYHGSGQDKNYLVSIYHISVCCIKMIVEDNYHTLSLIQLAFLLLRNKFSMH